MGLTVPSYVVPGEQATGVIGKLTDHTDYGTGEPSGNTTWTATLKSTGDTVQLKEDVGDDFADSIEKDYSNLTGDFWGSEPSFYFDISAADIGDSIVLCAEDGDAFGYSVSEEDEIPIIAAVVLEAIKSISVTLTLTDHEISSPSSPKLRVKVSRTPTEQIDWPQFGAVCYYGDPIWWSDDTSYNEISEFTCSASYSSITAVCTSPVEGKVYSITLDADTVGNAGLCVTFNAVITRDDDSTEEEEYSFTIDPHGGKVTSYVYINIDNRSVVFSGWEG